MYIFLVFLIFHFIGDFWLQQIGNVAQVKYKDPIALYYFHCVPYGLFMFLIYLFVNITITNLSYIIVLIVLSHFLIDYVTSKATHYCSDKFNNHWVWLKLFWFVIGLDQILHVLTIYWAILITI